MFTNPNSPVVSTGTVKYSALNTNSGGKDLLVCSCPVKFFCDENTTLDAEFIPAFA